jgi:hypothetical protein
MARNTGVPASSSCTPGSVTATTLPVAVAANALVPSGVPLPVGPSYPAPAWHRYRRPLSQVPLEPEVTSFRAVVPARYG